MGSESPTLPARGLGIHFRVIVKRHTGFTIVHSGKARHITNIFYQSGLLATFNFKGTGICNSFVCIRLTAPLASTTISKQNKMAILK